MRSGLCWLTISQERRARALFSSDIDSLCSFLSRVPRRVVAPQSCIVEPSEAEHMSQMHYFCLPNGIFDVCPEQPAFRENQALPLFTGLPRRVLLGGLVHQVAPPPPHPLKALLLRPPPEARGRFLLCFFFEAAKLRAKLLRVLAKRQTPAAQLCRIPFAERQCLGVGGAEG